PGAAEVRMADHRILDGLEGLAGPLEPAVALLVEDEQRLVAQLRELRPPAGAALHGLVGQDPAHDVDLLAVVDLVPDRLEHLLEQRRVGIGAVHEPAHVGEAHVAAAQLFLGQHADAAVARVVVALEGEVHLLDAVALGGGAEGRLGAGGGPAVEHAVLGFHDDPPRGGASLRAARAGRQRARRRGARDARRRVAREGRTSVRWRARQGVAGEGRGSVRWRARHRVAREGRRSVRWRPRRRLAREARRSVRWRPRRRLARASAAAAAAAHSDAPGSGTAVIASTPRLPAQMSPIAVGPVACRMRSVETPACTCSALAPPCTFASASGASEKETRCQSPPGGSGTPSVTYHEPPSSGARLSPIASRTTSGFAPRLRTSIEISSPPAAR